MSSPTQILAPSTLAPARHASSPYIVGPVYDWLFFLGTPLAALWAGFLISRSPAANAQLDFHGFEVTRASLFLGILIHAHLFAVFFRSHGNPQIFSLHPIRFLVVPVALYAGMLASGFFFVVVSVTATFWDVYHSGMQTFGFGRIYDAKRGNDPLLGRRLDWALNILCYAGPIVGGATMLDHFEDFREFEEVGAAYFSRVPEFMEGIHGTLAMLMLVLGGAFLIFYIGAYVRFAQRGYRVSWLKVWLYTSTALASIYAWGFNAFGEAFFIMNSFHAIQYFGIVWAREQGQMSRYLEMSEVRWGKLLTLVVFLALCLAYGYFAEAVDTELTHLWAITLVVSILHFWYDGFIWSVRRSEV